MTTSFHFPRSPLVAALSAGAAAGLGATLVDAVLLVLRSRMPPAPLREVLDATASAGAVYLGAGLAGGALFALAAVLSRKLDPARPQSNPDSAALEARRRRVDRATTLLVVLGLAFTVIAVTNRATTVPATLRRHAFVAVGVLAATTVFALVFGLVRRGVDLASSLLAPRRWAVLVLCAAAELAALFLFARAPHAQQNYVALVIASFSISALAYLSLLGRIPRAAQASLSLGALLWVGIMSVKGTSAGGYHLLRMGRTLPAAILRELPSPRPEPFADDLVHAVEQALSPTSTSAPTFDVSTEDTTAKTPAADRSDIILVTVDTLRADRLYGKTGTIDAHMPSLAALAGESIVYSRAFAAAPATIGAVKQIMTGKPERDLVHLAGRSSVAAPLSPETNTLARRLGALGYETVAIVGGRLASYYPSLALGFSRVIEDAGATRAPLSAPSIVEAFTRFASRPGRPAPLFAWLHLMEPHDHSALPLPVPAGYAAATRLVDDEIGRLVAFLRASPRWSTTTMLILADHGEGLGERGFVHHGLAHPLDITIPFVARFPGTVPRIEPTAVSHLDVAPTVLRAAGDSPVDLPGRALQTLEPGNAGLSRRIFFENAGYAETAVAMEVGVVELPWFYAFDVRAGRSLLVDLDADPQGLFNLADERPAEAARLARVVTESLRGHPSPAAHE